MARLPRLITQLALQLERLPGIGPKTAEKLAYHLARQPRTVLDEFGVALSTLADGIRTCKQCGDFSEAEICAVCSDPGRDNSLLCVVADSAELHALERLNEFTGRYHVLGGTIRPIEGIEPGHLRMAELQARLENGEIKEVILGLNPDLEGETTALYLTRLLKQYGVAVTKLARGLPTGSEIEYADDSTLSSALRHRRQA